MADRRYVAQSISDSGQVAQLVATCGPWAGLLFSWLIPSVDDDGRFVGDPDAVRHKILGRYLDLVSEEQVAQALAVMNDLELVVWYEVVGAPAERYVYFPKFALHQTLRTDRYGPSRFPPPPGWQPEEGHPYTKNPNLQKEKPQRDRRRTVRITKRAVNAAYQTTLATVWRPAGASLATAAQPSADRLAPSGDEASRHVTSPLLTSPLPTAERNRSAEDVSLRSDDAGTEPRRRTGSLSEGSVKPSCYRRRCGHAWVGHRGPGDPAFTGARECVAPDCTCPDYVEFEGPPDVVASDSATSPEVAKPEVDEDPFADARPKEEAQR